MTTQGISSAVTWTTTTVRVCGGDLSFVHAGQGDPLLVLPRENGHPPRNEFLDRLASGFSVYYPFLPGFHGGHPADWEWLASVRDLAVVMRQFVEAQGLDRPVLAGLGFGGWLAAEMATMGSTGLRGLVLIGPMGIQPQDAYICDQFLVSTDTYSRTAFEDQSVFQALYGDQLEYDQLESWETDREMTSRIAWKPYMYNRSLPRLLAGFEAPALVLWGEADRVVPLECAARYGDALSNATVETYPGCGHAVELERPGALAARVATFCNGLRPS